MAKRFRRAAGVRESSKDGAPRRRATTIKPEGHLALVDGLANSRLFVYLTARYLQRVEQARRELYFGDRDLALVAECIGAAGIEPGMRDAEFRDVYKGFNAAIAVAEMRAINATSIAEATGMPRETVRRKLKQLVTLGFIVEKEPSRYVLKPGVLLQPERLAAFARGIEQTVHFINDLLENGTIRWVAAGKAKQGSRQT